MRTLKTKISRDRNSIKQQKIERIAQVEDIQKVYNELKEKTLKLGG